MTEVRAFATSFQDAHDGLVSSRGAGVEPGELVLLYEIDAPSFASWGRVVKVLDTTEYGFIILSRPVGHASEYFHCIYADDDPDI